MTSGRVFSRISEDILVDQHRQDPQELLLKAYQNNRILLLGFPNHNTFEQLHYLAELLKEVGTDKKLKFVILERPHDNDSFYEMLSKHDLSYVMKNIKFESTLSQKNTLCEAEWGYGIKNVMPIIRNLNKVRSILSPLLVKTIDGLFSGRDFSWPGRKELREGNCAIKDLSSSHSNRTIYIGSSNREADTAQNFDDKIWKNLKNDEKVIIVYNIAHLIYGFESCFPHMISENEWISNLSPLTWMHLFLDKYPEAKQDMGLILFDSAFEENFKLTERQKSRIPDVTFGLPLLPFKDSSQEKGADIFNPWGNILGTHGSNLSGNSTLPEIAEGIILISKRDHLSRFALGFASEYLPDYCIDINSTEELNH